MNDARRLHTILAGLSLIEDGDGDGLPDSLTARLVLGAGAALPETIAAMHLAARLAFETLALRAPLVTMAHEPLSASIARLHIGRPETVASDCPEALTAALATLSTGEGAIAVSAADQAVLIGGADAAGLEVATLAFCRAWDPAQTTDDRTESIAVLRVAAAACVTAPDISLGDSGGSVLRSLADLYGPAGFSADTDGDLLPDRFRTRITLPDDLSMDERAAAIEFAARLGLESLGLALPSVFPRGQAPTAAGVVTVDIAPLGSDDAPTTQGTGSLRLSGEAERGWTVRVAGNDARGRLAAIQELAHLDRDAAGVPTLEAVEQSLARLCALADPGTTLLAATVALPRIPSAAGGPAEVALHCPPFLAAHAGALAKALEGWAHAHCPEPPVIPRLDPTPAPLLLDLSQDFPWEVDDAWEIVRTQVLPALDALSLDDRRWLIDIRVSEPEGRRKRIKLELLALIRAAGRVAAADQVRVLPAYRQGTAWLLEEMLPHVLQVRPARLLVRVARFTPEYPSLELPIRWLQDLFPVDELLAVPLGLALDAIQFEVVEQDHTYVLEALDASGAVLLRRDFDVVYGQRPYLQRFPAWGAVHPSTGCVRLEHNGARLVDTRLAPDPERLWDYLQGTVLPLLEEQIRATCGGEPRRDAQPFFGDLTVDVWLSEDDTAAGVREERNSPLEALHEDIYFTLLDFCSALLGNVDGYLPPWIVPTQARRGARGWTAPGRVIPRIHRRDGAAGRIRVRMAPVADRVASLRWRSAEKEGTIAPEGPANVAIALTGLEVEPRIGGQTRSRRLVVTLSGPIDQQERAVALLGAWGALRAAVPEISRAIPANLGLIVERQDAAPLIIGAAPAGAPSSAPIEPCGDVAHTPVLGDRILGIEAIEGYLRALCSSSRVRAYQAGRSAQGRPSYAIELTAPRTEGWWSRARLSAWKCTLLLNARHHANEPSSANALLEVARLLAHDPDWSRYLDRVNVVILPCENPDGMALYDELVDEHPTWMHHAARYNAAGLEFAAEYSNPCTRHTEALVLPAVWRRWAPDIVCDDHGFPAHEWLQLFAGQGNPWFRDYWIAQGLIFAYLPTIRSPRYPRHWEAMSSLRERMIRVLAADPEVAIWNRMHADRYRAYMHRWAPEQFPAPYDRDVLMHVSEYDPDAVPPGSSNLASLPGRFPGVTTASITTEVADESAQGGYMALCARAHLLLDRALLDYLYDANAPAAIQRSRVDQPGGGLVLMATRPRPVVAGMLDGVTGG